MAVVGEKTKLRAILQARALQAMIRSRPAPPEFGIGNAFDTTFYVKGAGEYEGQGEHRTCATSYAAAYQVALMCARFPYQVHRRSQGQAGIGRLAQRPSGASLRRIWRPRG
jgi:hypothetical protein